MTAGKPYCISKWAVQRAWGKVRANRGAAGVDGETIQAFERRLKNNLYQIWNRMSSGSYFPPPPGAGPAQSIRPLGDRNHAILLWQWR